MDRLQKYYKESLMNNLCQEYKGMWQSAFHDRLSLVRLSLAQQSIPHVATYAYKRIGLTKEYITKNFPDYINGYTVHDADGVEGYTYGLFVDYDFDNDIIADKDVIHIMWTVGATVVIPKTKCPTVYVSNKSKVHLVCEGFNSIKVYIFDESEVTIEDADVDTSVTVFRYSDDAKVDIGRFCLSEKVKDFRKQLKL